MRPASSLAFALSCTLLTALSAGTAIAAEPDPMAQTIQFNAEHLHEVALIDLADGQTDIYFEEYLPRLQEVIAEHGGSLSARFETIDVVNGRFAPQFIMMFDWPDQAAWDNAQADIVATRAVSPDLFRTRHSAFFTLATDASFRPEPGQVFEFYAGSAASERTPELMREFRQRVIPLATQYGRAALLQLSPADLAPTEFSQRSAGLVIWPDAASFHQFTHTDIFKDAARDFRDPASADLMLINTYYMHE